MPMDCSLLMHGSFILVYPATKNLHLATSFYRLLFIGHFPKKLAPKKVFRGQFTGSQLGEEVAELNMFKGANDSHTES